MEDGRCGADLGWKFGTDHMENLSYMRTVVLSICLTAPSNHVD